MRKKKERIPLTAEERVFMEELYEKHKKTMYFAARRETSDPELIKDLMQECFLNLIKNISTVRKLDCCKVDAYIVVVIRRLYINHAKKESRTTLLPIELPSIAAKADIYAAEIAQEQEDAKLDLETMLAQLSVRDSLLLQSKYITGMEDEALAAEFGCKPSSIRMLLSRARKRAEAIGLRSEEGDEKQHG